MGYYMKLYFHFLRSKLLEMDFPRYILIEPCDKGQQKEAHVKNIIGRKNVVGLKLNNARKLIHIRAARLATRKFVRAKINIPAFLVCLIIAAPL